MNFPDNLIYSSKSGTHLVTPKQLKLLNFKTYSSILGIHLVTLERLKLHNFFGYLVDFCESKALWFGDVRWIPDPRIF